MRRTFHHLWVRHRRRTPGRWVQGGTPLNFTTRLHDGRTNGRCCRDADDSGLTAIDCGGRGDDPSQSRRRYAHDQLDARLPYGPGVLTPGTWDSLAAAARRVVRADAGAGEKFMAVRPYEGAIQEPEEHNEEKAEHESFETLLTTTRRSCCR